MRRLALLAAVSITGTCLIPAGASVAATQVVSGMVLPSMSVTADGANATVPVTISRERRGDTVIVTVIPR